VLDHTPPVITCPPSFATDSAPGRCEAEVALPPPTAADGCSAMGAVWTVPASGATLPVGANVVYGLANDAHENGAACQFIATVVDAEAPTITAPPDQVVDATGPDGAVVTYAPFTAGDNCAVGSVTSEPPSGSTFPIDEDPAGVTIVTGVATDTASHTTVASFAVHVKGAAEQLRDVLTLVETLPRHEGLEHQLFHALRAVEAGRFGKACHQLGALSHELAEHGREECLPAGAEVLLPVVTRLRAVLACPARGCGDEDHPDHEDGRDDDAVAWGR
jgi:hypothetical protein